MLDHFHPDSSNSGACVVSNFSLRQGFGPSFFEYARRPFVWVVNSEDAKTIKMDFSRRFFFATKEPTSLSGRSVFFAVCVCVLRFQGLAGGSNEVSRCTEFFPSGSLACEPTCTRPKLSPVRKKTCKLKNAEYTFKKTQELFNKGVSKQNKSKKAKRIPQASQQNGAVALL